MKKEFEKFIAILIVSGLFLGNVALGHTEGHTDHGVLRGESHSEVVEEAETVEVASDFEEVDSDEEEGSDETEDDLALQRRQQEFLLQLKQELSLSKTDFRQVDMNVIDTQQRLLVVQEEKITLQLQLDNIENLIDQTSARLMKIITDIIEKENEIELVNAQIKEKETALEYQKELLRDYIRLLYVEENTYFSFEDDGEVNPFKLLLADGSVGANLKELQYFDLLNDAGQQMIDRLAFLQNDLELEKKYLGEKKKDLENLYEEVTHEQEQLTYQKDGKENLLKLTQGQEEIYKQLLEQSIAEREEVLDAVRNFSNAVDFIAWKIEEDGENFNPEDYYSLLDYRTQAVYRFTFGNGDGTGVDFIWPLEPTNGISAYFRDPGYVNVFGVRHNAVDIPRNQRTPVRVAADGVVYMAKDNGYGYSYIIVAHRGGFLSVYGHMNEILVDEGQSVPQGFVIGLSGGMPGTEGAGYMTTGPHLHFELLLNGLWVDPLVYLPLEAFSEDDINDLPDKYYVLWQADVAEANREKVSRLESGSGSEQPEDFEKVTR